ncbi:MAG: lysylphosphatidylglycerol synthase transmembrane domain-containing protein, partial [Isosphaeraceae bacterium]
QRSLRGRVINLALVATAFVLLGLVLWRNREKIHAVFSHPLDLRLLVLGIAIFQCSLIITYMRWYLLVRVIEPRFTLRATLLLGFIGYVFNLVIPGAVGGDFIKAAYLVRMHIKKTQAIASMLIDRIVGLLGLFVLAAVAGVVSWSVATVDVQKLIVTAWVALGSGFLVLALIFAQAFTRFIPRSRSSGHSRLGGIVTELNAMSTTYRRRLDIVLAGLLLSVAGHVLNVYAFYLMGKMLFPSALPTTLGQHFLMVPLTLFTMVVPIPFGALGVSEEAANQIGKLVGHPGGALAMLAFRVLMYSCGLISACVYLAKHREIQSLTAEAHHLEEDLEDGSLDENGDS